MTLQQKFDRTLGSLTLNGAGLPSFLLAVSGGVDSMTLATLFLNSAHHPKFEVAHVNFSLRGDESDGDETLVRTWCDDNGITLHVRRFDTLAYAKGKGISVEMAARELRYGWFRELLEERGLDMLAVAHNLKDNIETLFLNLLRGTGLRGASGMQMLSGNLFRPLLETSRKEIEQYANDNAVRWRTDHTNLESDFARNRIRNEVFPQLEKINPSFLKSISDSMKHFAQAQQVLDEDTKSKIAELSFTEDDSLNIDIAALKSEKCRSYWLFRILEKYGFNSAQIKEIEDAANNGDNVGKIFVSDSCKLVRDRKFLKIYTGQDPDSPLQTTEIQRTDDFNPKALPSGVLCVDADTVEMPLKEREWQDGDRFRPFGMRGTRLVSDFLTDLKFDREQKRRQRVVTDAQERIICLKGVRIDDRYKLTDKTKHILLIS